MDTPLPTARRLNRNAAIAAALLGGSMILIVGSLVTSAPEIRGREDPATPGEAEPQAPTFLDRPPVPPPTGDASLAELLGSGATRAEPELPAEPDPAAWYPAVDPYAGAYPMATPPPAPDPLAQARARALTSALLPGGEAASGPPGIAEPAAGAADPTGLAATSGAAGGRERRLAAEVHAPGAAPEVPAGTVVHAVLVTAVNSDAPGDAVAQVTHDVFDRGMRVVLIPRGSRLLGRPAGSAVLGQRRLPLVWDRIVLPDGRTVLLPEVPSQDVAGAGAHAARVDHHTGAVMRSALLLSLVGAGAQLSQPQQSATFGQAPSMGQTMAGAAGAQLAQVSGEMIRRGMDVRPTLSLPQGTPIQLLLTGDLALEPAR